MTNKKHLTLSERITIEKGLNKGTTPKSFADFLGMDKTSICKENQKSCCLQKNTLQSRFCKLYVRLYLY